MCVSLWVRELYALYVYALYVLMKVNGVSQDTRMARTGYAYRGDVCIEKEIYTTRSLRALSLYVFPNRKECVGKRLHRSREVQNRAQTIIDGRGALKSRSDRGSQNGKWAR